MKKPRIEFFLLILVLTPGCRKRDIADPSYICIPEIRQLNKPGQGTEIHGIEYVSVLISDNSVGTYSVPNTFPLLNTGKVEVQVRPLIKWLARDGLRPYGMLDYYTDVLDLEVLKADTLRPEFQYHDNVEFAWTEDFNDNAASLHIRSGTFDTFYVENRPEHTRDGSPYMYIPMGAGESFFEIESDDLYELAQDGREVYLEIDYKTNVPFTIGLYATSSTQVVTLPSVTPFDTEGAWKKGYVYLTDEVFNQGNDVRFRVFFRSANAEVANPEIFIDNLKLLYRKG